VKAANLAISRIAELEALEATMAGRRFQPGQGPLGRPTADGEDGDDQKVRRVPTVPCPGMTTTCRREVIG
jgi:hypothetical protein